MGKTKKYSAFEITVLGTFPGVTVYENQLYIGENPGEDTVEDYKAFRDNCPGLPAKIRFVSFIFCTGGSVHARLSMKDYTLRKDQILLVSGGSVLESFKPSPDFKAVFISFTPDFIALKNTSRSTLVLHEHLVGPEILSFDEGEAEEFLCLVRAIKNVTRKENDAYKDEAIEGIMLVFTAKISSALTLKGQDAMAVTHLKGSEIMRRFILTVRQHYMMERSVGFYAERLCISPKYFAQVIYKESGKYAKDWIREYVIRDAKAMLKSGSYTVQEVSDALHFANPSFFGKYFKEAVGCSPRSYKERIKESP